MFSLANGKLEIGQDNATRRALLSHVNDNVFQNISQRISLRSYDKDHHFHKSALDAAKKQAIITDVIEESAEVAPGAEAAHQNKEFGHAIDKILIAHRNTKFFLFCMSWQFFLVYFVLKKTMQGLVLYYLYKKRLAVTASEPAAQ